MKKKMKMVQTPKWLGLGVAALLIVGGIYAISNSTGNLAGNNKQLGAVAASASSDLSKPKAGGVSAGTSSVQPIINVTTWPNFELKFGAAGGENNLVAKAEYSITAQGGKIFVPVNWALMSIKNSLGQYAYPRLVENKSLDAVSIVSCAWGQTCYVIPAGKTIRFTVRQVYEPAQMFGGVYSGKLDWMYFNTVENNNDFYYKAFPAQTSKLNTITIIGEKSPYLYTTAIEATQGQNFTIKGVRLNGSTPFMEGSDAPGIVSRDDSSVTFNGKLPPPGVYRLYFSHPTYGNSNNAWVTVKAAAGISLVSPVGGETWPIGSRQTIKWENKSLADGAYVIYLSLLNQETGKTYPLSLSGSLRTPASSYSFNVPIDVPQGNYYIATIEASSISGNTKFTDASGVIKITPPNTACPQVVTIDNAQYTISPCQINATMIDGRGDISFSANIIPKNSSGYGFGVYGYGVGFPTYGVLTDGTASGGASGTTTLKFKFTDQVLSANGASPKTYTGYLPIGIYHGSANGSQISYLNLNLNLTVNPSSQATSTPVN